MRRLLAAVLLVASVSLLGGCSSEWRKKFIRKRKQAPPQAVLVLQPDYLAVMPAADRYREHFAFWKSWHEQLLDSFGTNKKRDLANLNGAIGELRSMQVLLTGQPADRLKDILEDLDEMEERWDNAPSPSHPSADRTSLERIQREVGKKYHYSNIKQTVVPEPERKPD